MGLDLSIRSDDNQLIDSDRLGTWFVINSLRYHVAIELEQSKRGSVFPIFQLKLASDDEGCLYPQEIELLLNEVEQIRREFKKIPIDRLRYVDVDLDSDSPRLISRPMTNEEISQIQRVLKANGLAPPYMLADVYASQLRIIIKMCVRAVEEKLSLWWEA